MFLFIVYERELEALYTVMYSVGWLCVENMMVMLRGVETSLGTTKHARFYEGFGQGWPVSNTRQKIYQTHKVVWLSIIAPLSTWT